MIRAAVSILNHNSAHSTVACVQSLLGAVRKGGETHHLQVFVADNESDERDRDYLRQSLAGLPNVYVQINAENMGFAAGHNRNLAVIFDGFSPDYVWVLNNDCLVYEETLSSLIESAVQYPGVGIWGATLLEADGETIQCAGGCFYNSWISSYRQYGRGKSLADIGELGPVEYDYIAGASLFFPVNTLQNGLRSVGSLSAEENADAKQWLNESLFLYFEELDLAQRLKPGFGMAWSKKALIKHVGGESTGASNGQRTDLAEYHSTLSALKFTRQYYPARLWFMMPARYLSKCLQLIIKGEPRLIRSLSKAYQNFLSDL